MQMKKKKQKKIIFNQKLAMNFYVTMFIKY